MEDVRAGRALVEARRGPPGPGREHDHAVARRPERAGTDATQRVGPQRLRQLEPLPRDAPRQEQRLLPAAGTAREQRRDPGRRAAVGRLARKDRVRRGRPGPSPRPRPPAPAPWPAAPEDPRPRAGGGVAAREEVDAPARRRRSASSAPRSSESSNARARVLPGARWLGRQARAQVLRAAPARSGAPPPRRRRRRSSARSGCAPARPASPPPRPATSPPRPARSAAAGCSRKAPPDVAASRGQHHGEERPREAAGRRPGARNGTGTNRRSPGTVTSSSRAGAERTGGFVAGGLGGGFTAADDPRAWRAAWSRTDSAVRSPGARTSCR